MKVAIVTSGFLPVPPAKGGAVESLVQYIVDENERQRGMDLVVYSCLDRESEQRALDFTATDFRFVSTPAIVRAADRVVYFVAKHIVRKEKHLSYRYVLQRLHFIRSVGSDLAKSAFDQVVFENHPTLLGALRIGQNRERYKGKYCYHTHNSLTGLYGCRDEMLGCRKVIGVSDYILRDFLKSVDGFCDTSRLAVLKNRVDEKMFGQCDDASVRALREQYAIGKDCKVVLFAGRLCSEKGALELIEAFSRAEVDDAILLIVGAYYFGSSMTSEYETKLRARAEDLGDRIVFTGFVDHDDMGAFYALADVVVAPSIWEDPAPLSVVEPLTAGVPLITTRRGGIPEYVTDGVDGIVLEADESLTERLALAIKAILHREIHLQRCDSYDLSIASFYKDYLALVTQDESDRSRSVSSQRQGRDEYER